jgi:RecA/RadA recombinase
MASLLDTLKEIGSIKSEVISQSGFFKQKDAVQTSVPIINAAFTGTLDGGLVCGSTIIAGPSKHFKTLLALFMVQAYMEKHKDAICIFYDSEFGVTPEYLAAQKIDGSRVLHIPILHIEQLKFDIMKKLEAIKKGNKVIIFIDSLGNLASKKEIEDTMDEKSVADMTRAKQLKSLFRMVTPHLPIKDIPLIAIQHTYDTQEMFSKTVVSGGTGQYYSANNVFIIGRAMEKDGTDLTGYKFTINIDKSRFVKEKSKMAFSVSFDGGINKFSGLLELALESGHVTKPSNGWYQKRGEEAKFREADTNNLKFFGSIISDKEFGEFVRNKYQLAVGNLVSTEV